MICLWTERELLNFFTMLFTPCLSDHDFFLFSLFHSTLVQSFTIVYLLILGALRLRHWWPSCCWPASLSWLSIVDFEVLNVISFERQIWIWISMWIWSSQLLWTLLLLHCTSVQSLMDWSIIELTPLCLSLLFLLLHNVPWAYRYHRSIHSIACRTTIFEISVHFSLPRHVIVRKRHVKSSVCLLLSLMGCS